MSRIKTFFYILIITCWTLCSCNNNKSGSIRNELPENEIPKNEITEGFISVNYDYFLKSKDSLMFYLETDSLYGFITNDYANVQGKEYDLMNTSADTLMILFNSIGFYPEYSILEFQFDKKNNNKYQLKSNDKAIYLQHNRFLKVFSHENYLIGKSVSINKNNRLFISPEDKSIVANYSNYSYVVDSLNGNWLYLVSDKEIFETHLEGWAKLKINGELGVVIYYSY